MTEFKVIFLKDINLHNMKTQEDLRSKTASQFQNLPPQHYFATGKCFRDCLAGF